ncbi:MAG: cytochrome c biogenesis protein CcdA, partial [Methylovirgula sp.]
MASDVTLTAAAAAGLLSFLSPCVLPLVPPYLS